MSNGKRGRRKEYQVRDILIAEGYLVTRAAASKGAFDLIAIPTRQVARKELHEVRLIQVKSKKFSKQERLEMQAVKAQIASSFHIECWVVQDRKVPYIEFTL